MRHDRGARGKGYDSSMGAQTVFQATGTAHDAIHSDAMNPDDQ